MKSNNNDTFKWENIDVITPKTQFQNNFSFIRLIESNICAPVLLNL